MKSLVSNTLRKSLGGLLAACALITAQPGAAAEIPEAQISALREELAGAAGADSASQGRRICKSVIRQAQALLTATPDATNRFPVLGLIHDSQRRLLSLENTQENREALFATAAELIKAPDEFAELRLDADFLLMEKTMGEKKATVAERSQALEELLASYRGTPAESRSLMIGTMIATKLLDLELVARIKDRTNERFADDHTIIRKWRSDDSGERFDAVFQGIYQSANDQTVSLPMDMWGHNYLAFFWSEKTPRIDDHLKEIKELQAAHPGALRVLSFNVDALPDAGQGKLKKLGLDWTVLHLPGGRENPAFRAYAGIDPCAFIVNAQGRVMLESPAQAIGLAAAAGAGEKAPATRSVLDFAWQIDDSRYLAQLRSLFIGDFLVADESLTPPFRYRLSRDEELAAYRKLAELTAPSDSPDAWMLQNKKIIALIGLWNLTGETTQLDAAVTEAGLVLAKQLPPGGDVVSRFCLAKAALRKADANPDAIIADFLAQCGGEKAPASAIAAATMLALEGNARSTYDTQSSNLLALGDDIAQELWPVRAFLLDRHHRHRNFHALPGGLKERRGKAGYRVMLSGLDDPSDRNARVSLELKTPDGAALTLPNAKSGRMLGVVFAEPSADAATQTRLMERANAFAKSFKNYDTVDVVVVMLTDDAKIASAMVPEDKSYQVALLPGGLKNPLVQKLGILSADRMPNLLLFRSDGTLAWGVSGLTYRYAKNAEGPDLPVNYAIANNLEKLTSDVGFDSLERGDYAGALKQFDAFAPKRPRENWWHSDRTHARALAQMGLKDWEAALTTIDDALAQRMVPGRCKCHGVVEILLTKAMILDQLKRTDEAKATRALVDQETQAHPATPTGKAFIVGIAGGIYYDWLKRIRLNMEAKP
jgi:hypothetical protein